MDPFPDGCGPQKWFRVANKNKKNLVISIASKKAFLNGSIIPINLECKKVYKSGA